MHGHIRCAFLSDRYPSPRLFDYFQVRVTGLWAYLKGVDARMRLGLAMIARRRLRESRTDAFSVLVLWLSLSTVLIGFIEWKKNAWGSFHAAYI
jgi:hypothetical protein